MPARNLILLLVAAIVCLAAWRVRETSVHGRRFHELLAHIERSHLDPADPDALFDAAVRAVVGRLDEHSAVVRGEDRRDLEAALDQRFAGVGLELAIDPVARLPEVVAALPRSPAWRAGIVAGERIEALDGAEVAGLPLRDVVRRLRGRPGEPVAVRLRGGRGAEATLDPGARSLPVVREVTLVREEVKVESVLGDRRRADGSWDWMLEGEEGVALVRITSFGERTIEEVRAALAALAAGPPLRGLVLDLRGNPGGLLAPAVATCDELLDEGVIVSLRGRRAEAAAPRSDVRRANRGAALAGVPVAVLVDGLTASAAEIVAGCLQDHGRATVIGSRSFGKGTVQSILPLSDGETLLKLTTSEYLRPSERRIHRPAGEGDDGDWGVSPDAGFEIAPPGAAIEQWRRWRRARDAAAPEAFVSAAAGLPRDRDAVLATALRALSAASAADLGREEEAAGDADQPVAPGQ